MIEMLPTARDIAIIVLAVEAVLVLIVPLILLWHSIRALRRTRPRVATWLYQTNLTVARGTQRINHALLAIRRPFIWFETAFSSLTSVLKRAAQTVQRAAHWMGSGR